MFFEKSANEVQTKKRAAVKAALRVRSARSMTGKDASTLRQAPASGEYMKKKESNLFFDVFSRHETVYLADFDVIPVSPF